MELCKKTNAMKKLISVATLFLYCLGVAAQGMIAEKEELAWPQADGEEKKVSHPVPYTLKNIELPNGLRMEYAEQGDWNGIPVVFLHGLSDSWHSYELVLPHLPSSVHAFALTLRGHGNSGRPPEGYLPRHFSDDVAAFIKTLKLGRVVVVGHSMGATVAQHFVLDHGHLVSGFVLVGSFASYQRNPAMVEFSREVAGLTDPVGFTFAEAFQKSTISIPVPPAYLDTMIHETMKLPARVFQEALGGLMASDYTAELKNVRKPALLLWGENDALVPGADQQKLKKILGNATLITYPGTGHAVHWEQPQLFTADLMRFLNELGRQ